MSRVRVAGAAVAALAFLAIAVSAAAIARGDRSGPITFPASVEAARDLTGDRAVLIRATTTLPEGTEVRDDFWVGRAGLEGGASHATVTDGTLDFYIDVPNCSNGWADSWGNQRFAIAAVTPGNDAQRVTASYWWPSRVCG